MTISINRHRLAIPLSLLFAAFLWGGNNTAVRCLVCSWPPLWAGASRLIMVGVLMMALLRWTNLLGSPQPCPPNLRRDLWIRGGLLLGIYFAIFNWALQRISASHMALYMGATPVWALLWEGRDGQSGLQLIKRYTAVAMAFCGVLILFWPALYNQSPGEHTTWQGECLGLASSILWVAYGRECRRFGARLSGAVVTSHTMLVGGLLLLPMGFWEIFHLFQNDPSSIAALWNPWLLSVQSYCIVFGGIAAFGIWNNALRHWKTSEVYLFNNLIPVFTLLWAHFCLSEPVNSTFWFALILIAGGSISVTRRDTADTARQKRQTSIHE